MLSILGDRGKKAVERREKSVAVPPDSWNQARFYRGKRGREGKKRGETKTKTEKEKKKKKERKKRGVTIVRWPLTAPVDAFYFELAYLRRRRSHRACESR